MPDLDKRALDRWIQDPDYPNNPQRETDEEEAKVVSVDVEFLVNVTYSNGDLVGEPQSAYRKFKTVDDARAWCAKHEAKLGMRCKS